MAGLFDKGNNMHTEQESIADLLKEIRAGLFEAKVDVSFAKYNLYAMRDYPPFRDLEGVYVLLAEILPRIDSAFEAVAEYVKEKSIE